MTVASLVVVLVVHVIAIPAIEVEGDTPIAIDIHSPLALSAALERVESQPWRVQVPKGCRGLKPGQNSPNLQHMFRIQAPRFTGIKEPLQSAVPKPDDHVQV